jgi:hypothetical protein
MGNMGSHKLWKAREPSNTFKGNSLMVGDEEAFVAYLWKMWKTKKLFAASFNERTLH